MELFHGSLEIVMMPEIRQSNRTLDYGNGFYTTTSHHQAESWVKRRMKECCVNKGYVNVYDFYKAAADKLNVLVFNNATEEWVDFVMMNRTKKGFKHSYDIVYGPVANDRVYAAFALYEGGLLDKETLIKELKTYRLVDQFLFHTVKSLSYLKFKQAKEVLI